MWVQIQAAAVIGIEAIPIVIEVNVDKGVGYHLVGLPDNAVKESSFRIAAALKNNQYRFPGKKITVNLAPADLKKEGASFDLPIAIGILAASNQIDPFSFNDFLILGELSLSGNIQPIKGVLPITIEAQKMGFKYLIVPKQNEEEAAVVKGIKVFAPQTPQRGNACLSPS